jgi:hypothetical protein
MLHAAIAEARVDELCLIADRYVRLGATTGRTRHPAAVRRGYRLGER